MSIIGLNAFIKKELISQLGTDTDVSFAQPSREWAASITRPTINCWLFRMEENVHLRSSEQTFTEPTRRSTKDEERPLRKEKYPDQVTVGFMRYAPRRYDFNYLITAWSNETDDEHRLLWRALAYFNQTKLIKTEDLEGELSNQPYDIPISVAQPADTGMSMTDLWSVLDNQMHPGFIVTSTLALDQTKPEKVTKVEESLITIGQTTANKLDEMEPKAPEKPPTHSEILYDEKDPLKEDRGLIKKSPIEKIDATIRWKSGTKSDHGDTPAE